MIRRSLSLFLCRSKIQEPPPKSNQNAPCAPPPVRRINGRLMPYVVRASEPFQSVRFALPMPILTCPAAGRLLLRIIHTEFMQTRLLINIDHVATLRNARREAFPDPVHAAVLCEAAGADGIVFHLREDRRHISERDVRLLKKLVKTKLDFELSTDEDVVNICCEIKPNLATLVPERREEVTTEGGLNVREHRDRIERVVEKLYAADIEEVALFVNPDPDQIAAAAKVGANCVELHTGEYATAASRDDQEHQAFVLAEAADRAHQLGMRVHAGHGLDYHNYALFRQTVPHVHEVSIGFAVVARAVLVGMERAVRDMLDLVKR